MRQQKLSGKDEDEREHTKLLLKDLGSDGKLIFACVEVMAVEESLK